jgi:hypothetical protein
MYKLPIVCCLLVLLGCSKKKEQAASFYYWKTSFQLTTPEKQALSALHTKELYIRFFDVDKVEDSLVPIGVISGLDSVPDSIRIIPVVFITNRSFLRTSAKEVRLLADRLHRRITAMWPAGKKPLAEIQIDCDWSGQTKANYFLFLNELKPKLEGKILSATIRLHQVKYPLRTGVPPVDKGMLMFYNMGNAKNSSSTNSIYNRTDAEKYTDHIAAYPLPLDLALPVFSWQLQFRDGELVHIIPKGDCPDTLNTVQISKTKDPGIFEIKSPFLHKGQYYREGDRLKTERITTKELKEAAQLLAESKKEDVDGLSHHSSTKIVFFDLDEYNLKTISYENIEEVRDLFE